MNFIEITTICLAVLFPLIGAFTYRLDCDGKYYRLKLPFGVYIGLLLLGAVPVFNIVLFVICLLAYIFYSTAYALDGDEPPIKFFNL